MKKYAVIVAGGVGNRAGGFIPKQFQELRGVPVLWWSVRRFHEQDPATEIILVLNADWLELWRELHAALPAADRAIPLRVCTGGATRPESVARGLALIPDEEESLVAVHDAARPLIDERMVAEGWDAGKEYGAAVPVDDVTDSLRRLTADGSESVPRKDYVRVQTPQVFRTSLLKKAYDRPLTADMTDEASICELAGMRVALFKGDFKNIKVTNPIDFKIAELLLDGIS